MINEDMCGNFDDKNNHRILFLTSDNDKSSGAFISMVNLINILRLKYNLDIFVILPHEGTGIELLNDFNIPFKIVKSIPWVIPLHLKNNRFNKIKTFVKKILNYKAIHEISKFIGNNEISLVHINTTYSYVGAISAIKNDVPLVWHLREFLEEDQKRTIWDRKEGNDLINQSNRIIVISDSLKNKYINVFDNDKLIRIYNGVDDKKFYKPNKEIFKNDKLIFMIVGAIYSSKGQLDLAKACSKLYSEGVINFELWIIGEGEDYEKNKITEIFESSNMDNFKFLGYKKNVQDYYEKADISFTCSDSEAFGRTTVEAMLSGNLVIGSDSAGTSELLKDNKGLLYKVHDIDDLCNKIKFAIENPETSRKIAKTGRKYMQKNMTAENNADNIYRVYKDLLDINS